ncbi:MAG: hypothetical protein E5V72_01405 [Mesorhizobium sp.]|uniref:hypothetical protein n=1 Tax=Mesorhizobium sp. TaxID=1871066 RepID=UPI000FE85D13|nr:hypothetical protein [Mesorhizobium sp.]RWH52255.1 MAG: hypothetical protein EOQ82_26520 [Mesorhizobium sp.]RWI69712.1 MAG: hypothetical protein EOR18_21015 [Mesorhizobium sp.]RWI76179.1 MAG: hypothetical protein EOR19_18605 [Mesorhizobium sp.]RWJ33249.1 MAG: hypothetical protein EOR28_11735 [Mesorhizobium sp.]TIQ74079.1 MAG: hypothetical protein E5X40_06835 [Mesorhizobium sp.]
MRAQINHARRHATFNVSELRRQGYRQIGRGAFSRAFYHPDAPDVVIKVGKLYSKRVGLTDGFPHFAQRIIDGELTSKFFPKVYDLCLDAERQLFWCIMKRYTKTSKTKASLDINATMNKITGDYSCSGKPNHRYRRALEQLIDYRFVHDIHKGNVLKDDDDTPIIIDPICIRPRFQQEFYA